MTWREKLCLILFLGSMGTGRGESEQLSQPVMLTLHHFTDWEERGLTCNDGSPGGYYLKPASGESATAGNKWIFYLEGGGWCWDEDSCAERISSNTIFGPLISSLLWPPFLLKSGIFTMSDPEWAGATLVYVPYCSSDAHMGDTESDIPEYGLIQFRGRRLALAAVSDMVPLQNGGQEVLFGGTSAGGRGSMVLVDSVQDLLGPNNTLWGVHDSGAYQDIQPMDDSYTPFGSQCKAAYSMFQPPISAECGNLHPENELWRCVCGQYMLPNLLTKSQVLIYQYDSYQLGNDLGAHPVDWTEEMCLYAEQPFRQGMRITIEEVNRNPVLVAFGPACYHHGILTSSLFQTIQVDGVSAETQLLAFLSGIKLRAVSDCETVNCQETCPDIELGDHSVCNV